MSLEEAPDSPSGVGSGATSPPRPERDVAERPPVSSSDDPLERPLKGAAAAAAAAASTSADEWEAVVTPEGDTYYYHRATNCSQWARPAAIKRDFRECCYDAEKHELAWEAPPGAVVVDYADTQALAEGAETPRWVRCYYDAVSGETCWVPPTDEDVRLPRPRPYKPSGPRVTGHSGSPRKNRPSPSQVAAAPLEDAPPAAAAVAAPAPDVEEILEELDVLGASLDVPLASDAPPGRACWYDPSTEQMFWDQHECADPDAALPCWYDESKKRIDWATELPPPPPPAAAQAAPAPPPEDRDKRRHASLNKKMEQMQSHLRPMEAQLIERGIVPEPPNAPPAARGGRRRGTDL